MVSMKEDVRLLTLQYVNRLSDWLFILTRWVSSTLGESEILWIPKGKRQVSTVESTQRQQANREQIDDL
jgi:hypothetical protein